MCLLQLALPGFLECFCREGLVRITRADDSDFKCVIWSFFIYIIEQINLEKIG